MKKRRIWSGRADNGGFSLVELIVVMAIMTVIVGLLAPQYLQYVSNSKVSTDIANAENIADAVSAAFADSTYVLGETNIPNMPDGQPFPASRYDSSYAWDVSLDDEGLVVIKLGGMEIWPDPKAAGHYYNVLHR